MNEPLLIVIGYVWPEPNSSAAGSRMLSLIRLYRQHGWQVIFASAAEKSLHRFDLSELGVAEQLITLNDSSFDAWIAQLQPSAVLFDRFMLEEQFGWRVEQACPDAMRMLDMEDVHALRDARQRAFKDGDSDARYPAATYLNSELALREVAAIYRCDLTLVISEFEMQLLQQHYQVPLELLCYCPLLQWQDVEPGKPGFDGRQHFMTIGNFRHAPNWQSVLWLRELWPAIRAQLPAAELHIYGAYPPPKATALHQPKAGFYIKGWADDAAQVMQQARVCLAPLAFGAGLKGKLFDAMVQGTPSVTTPIGAEGMHGDLPWPGKIASEADHLIAAAIELYQNEVLWSEAQANGYRCVQQRFLASQWLPRLWSQLEQVRLQLADLRQRNFTGQMLRHHAYRSTKFMGQWIEAKTRLQQHTEKC
ncbi:glycosyltransferase [Alkalimonas amylolytica]|uniref:Glycosyltransferase involved in cell wall bisynthesis n=1 Tax=Alkalimonas amylolytica TaxID=152573 RepID=A0A1H3ZGR4_ALKAM|nr:glycosyltransferase [Alkalimonas amylolytica]SEA22847.1 Glycosyltransferase involved in cell wall bisynthesis [Alkalimonas amylolytica]